MLKFVPYLKLQWFLVLDSCLTSFEKLKHWLEFYDNVDVLSPKACRIIIIIR